MYIQNKLQPSYTEINKYKNQSSLINIKNNAQCNITAGEARLFTPPPKKKNCVEIFFWKTCINI